MKKVILRPIQGGQKVVELSVGKTIIGRGPLLECSDKKVSRNHAVLEVTQDGDVFITPTHVNPCFYQALGRGPSKVMKKDKQHPLFPGDSISLLPNNYKYLVQLAGDSAELGLQDTNGGGKQEVDGKEAAGTKGVDDKKAERETENGDGAESPEASSKPPSCDEKDAEKMVAAPRAGERTLPRWLLDSAGMKGATSDVKGTKGKKRTDRTATHKPPKRQARPRYTFSESEPDAEEEEDVDYVEPDEGGSKTGVRRRGREEGSSGRSSRRNRGTMQKISLDDFVASDDDEWENSSEGRRPRPEEDSGSDWERENKRGKRAKRYASSDSDSASDWERAGRRKKPATRVRRRKKSSSEEESGASEGEPHSRKSCKYGGRCYRRNAQHRKEYSHPGDSDYQGEESEEEEAEEEEEKEEVRPVCQYGADCYRKNELHRKTFDHPEIPKRSARQEREETKGGRNKGKEKARDEYEWKDEEEGDAEEKKGIAGRRRRRLRNEAPDD